MTSRGGVGDRWEWAVDDLGGTSTERVGSADASSSSGVRSSVGSPGPHHDHRLDHQPGGRGLTHDCTGGSVTLSWIWILYRRLDGGVMKYYLTGFNNTTNT